MILDTTTRKLQALMAGAVTTSNPTVVVNWSDQTIAAGVNGIGVTPSSLNGVTAVDILAAPAASTFRFVKSINIQNIDTVANTITVRLNDNATLYKEITVVLAVNDTLAYNGTTGSWSVTDTNGNIKSGVASAGRLIKTTTILNGTTSFTTQSVTTAIKCRLVAGGGGGGGTTTSAAAAALGGGGSAGSYAEKLFVVAGLTAYTVAVGAGGTAGSSSGGNGGVGGITTIAVGATTVTANGGLGGIGETAGSALAVTLGGAPPAVSTNGDLNTQGAPGCPGIRLSGLLGGSGAGGSSQFGGGGNGVNAAGAGVTPVGFGGGGSGGCVLNNSTAVAGGVGAPGVLIVEEFS